MALTFTTVNEQYGAGSTGTVSFALDRQISNGGDAAGLGAAWVATLDGSGNISISLPSTLDSNNRTPSGTTDARMRVHERVNSGNRIYYVSIPTSGPVDLGSLARTDDSGAPAVNAAPTPAPGQYMIPLSAGSTAAALVGNGNARVTPWLVTQRLAIDRLGAEVTVAGEAGSKVRLGIYADSGFCYPGALLLDAGQIDGTSATVQELTCSLALNPGLYWMCAVGQSAPTTSPTLRGLNNWTAPVALPVGSSIPSTNLALFGMLVGGVSGALPATFAAGATATGNIPRLFVRVA
jgi:hypothetical protein